jgi:MOSC domain-containing protein YiiM
MLRSFPRPGAVEWIGLSPGRKQPIVEVDGVLCEVGTGLKGDRHALSGRGKRQVTLVQHEHLAVVSALVGREVHGRDLRRNLVVSGINLWALKDRVFRVGEALLQGTGPCAPCNRMESNLGEGGYNAMRGHGGITASVLEAGWIRVGDAVEFVDGDGDDSLTQP